MKPYFQQQNIEFSNYDNLKQEYIYISFKHNKVISTPLPFWLGLKDTVIFLQKRSPLSSFEFPPLS